MQRRGLIVLAVSVVCLLIVCSALAQQPAGAGGGRGGGAGAGAAQGGGRGAGGGGGAAAGGGAARCNTSRIPLFFKEEWKTDAFQVMASHSIRRI